MLEEVQGSVGVYTAIAEILDRREEEEVFRYGGKEARVNLRLKLFSETVC